MLHLATGMDCLAHYKPDKFHSVWPSIYAHSHLSILSYCFSIFCLNTIQCIALNRKGELAGTRWRSRFGRPSVMTLGDVDPTGTYCKVPDDWLEKKFGRILLCASCVLLFCRLLYTIHLLRSAMCCLRMNYSHTRMELIE